MVEVDEEQRQAAAIFVHPPERADEMIAEVSAIAQSGQRVVLGHVADALLGLLALRDLILQPVVGRLQFLHMIGQPVLGLFACQLILQPRIGDGKVDWLGDIVVGSELESFHDIFGVDLCGDHDDRQVGRRVAEADRLEHLKAVHSWHHDVEQNRVEALRPDQTQR
ncbi:MAG TPA: hypothetical protein VN938_00910, partial [Xanthobacteraceae bacterium]|nr:hypothetical protein [Xanthobacteraceae bacterium]